MKQEETDRLKEEFEQAVHRVSRWEEPIPPDTLLRLYAYYKVARSEDPSSQYTMPLIDGFKANALLQVRHLSPLEAMAGYLETVQRELYAKKK